MCTASRFELHEKLAALNSGVNWAEVESSGQSCLTSYRKAEPAEARSFAGENKLSRIDNFYGQTFCTLRVLGWKGRNSLPQTEHTHKLQTMWRERDEPEGISDPLHLFYRTIWKRAHRKHLEGRKENKRGYWTSCLSVTFKADQGFLLVKGHNGESRSLTKLCPEPVRSRKKPEKVSIVLQQ